MICFEEDLLMAVTEFKVQAILLLSLVSFWSLGEVTINQDISLIPNFVSINGSPSCIQLQITSILRT